MTKPPWGVSKRLEGAQAMGSERGTSIRRSRGSAAWGESGVRSPNPARSPGVDSAARFALAVAAGCFIGLGGNLSTLAMSGTGLAFGLQQLLGGVAFSLGLVLVAAQRGQVFAADVGALSECLRGRVTVAELVAHGLTVLAGNFLGAFSLVLALFAAAQYALPEGTVGVAALRLAAFKCQMPFLVAFARGLLGGALMAWALWAGRRARSGGEAVVRVVLPGVALIACGFEHSVASLYFVPMGLIIQWSGAVGLADPGLTVGSFLVRHLVPVALGNVAGALFVASLARATGKDGRPDAGKTARSVTRRGTAREDYDRQSAPVDRHAAYLDEDE